MYNKTYKTIYLLKRIYLQVQKNKNTFRLHHSNNKETTNKVTLRLKVYKLTVLLKINK